MAHISFKRDPLPVAASLLEQGADFGIKVRRHAAIIAKLCDVSKQDFANWRSQTRLVSKKSINAIVAGALAYYLEKRFANNRSELARRSEVAESSIRNFLNPEGRLASKSGKEPSGKLTELSMLADALEVPMAKVNAPGTEFHGFALQGLVFTPPSPLPRVASGGMMLDAYDCPVCGYTELVERGK